jgi:hypothetical protein
MENTEKAKETPNNQTDDTTITTEMSRLSLADWGYLAMSDMISRDYEAAQNLGEYLKAIKNE